VSLDILFYGFAPQGVGSWRREVIEVDGSHGEGGGQILRTAVALSALTGKACRIERIRAGRPNPGLQASHLTAIRAAAEVCSGKVEGLRIGSTAVEFAPGPICGGEYAFDIGTAGAVSLVLQTLVPLALRADEACTFRLTGGTDVPWSPPMEYFEHVFCWWLHRMGVDIGITTKRRGFYPRGGGAVDIWVRQAPRLRALQVTEPGPVTEVHVESRASKDLEGARVAHRQVSGFSDAFGGKYNATVEYVPTYSPGSVIHAHAHAGDARLGGNSLGRKGMKAEAVGEECARRLRAELDSGATMDEPMSDQILLYAAFADGVTEFTARKLSGHAETTMWLLPQFLPCDLATELDGGRVRFRVTPR